MKVYVVTMYRWGDRQKHSYVLGVFSNLDIAITAAKNEAMDRGGKYFPEIVEAVLDCSNSENKVVKTIDDFLVDYFRPITDPECNP